MSDSNSGELALALAEWLDESQSQALLERGGLSGAAANEKAKLLRQCAEALLAAGLSPKDRAAGFFVPGRVELFGKHTDYAGGRSIVAATERGFCLLCRGRDDKAVRVINAAGGGECRFEMDAGLAPTLGNWSNYPMTVARRLARNFPDPPLAGADIALASDLPRASGMSSSSAMMVATYMAIARVNGLEDRPAWRAEISGPASLAEYLGTVENGQSYGGLAGDKGVGTFGGSEDHTAMLCCRAGMLEQYSYCPVRFERSIAMPSGRVLVVGSSGVVAEKTGGAMEKYNRASALASAVAEEWREATGRADPHIAAALRGVGEVVGEEEAEEAEETKATEERGQDARDTHGQDAHATRGQDGVPKRDSSRLGTPALATVRRAAGVVRGVVSKATGGRWRGEELVRRLDHFVAESEEIVPAAGEAMARNDAAELGRQAERSQELAERLLGNQVEETIYLATSARELGAEAASAFGAGFGGSVWAMVRAEEAGEFIERWGKRYRDRYPGRAGKSAFFQTRPGPGAFGLTIAD